MSKSLLLRTDTPDWADGFILCSIPLDRPTLEFLQERVRKFIAAQVVYPELYETYEFCYRAQYYETGRADIYDDDPETSTENKKRLARLDPYDFSDEGEDDAAEAELTESEDTKLLEELIEGNHDFLVVDTERLPSGRGNCRTECNQLKMSRVLGKGPVMIDWFCYIKHTDHPLLSGSFTADDVEKWLQELTEEEKGAL